MRGLRPGTIARDATDLYRVLDGIDGLIPALAAAPQPHAAKTSLV